MFPRQGWLPGATARISAVSGREKTRQLEGPMLCKVTSKAQRTSQVIDTLIAGMRNRDILAGALHTPPTCADSPWQCELHSAVRLCSSLIMQTSCLGISIREDQDGPG